MWLLQCRKVPDHSTIARFRSDRLVDCVDGLFNQFVKKLKTYGEVEFKNIFIDGTKIEANANKYTFVWKKSTEKFKAKLHEKIKKIVEEINLEFETEYIIPELKAEVIYLHNILEFLNENKESTHMKFVHGKGKRKTKLQRFIETISEAIERLNKYNNYSRIFDGKNSFLKTDKDATFMHMKEDHMRNSQLKPGYNMQIGVEVEYIVGVDISSERSDQLTFIPFLEKLSKNISERVENIVADAGKDLLFVL